MFPALYTCLPFTLLLLFILYFLVTNLVKEAALFDASDTEEEPAETIGLAVAELMALACTEINII